MDDNKNFEFSENELRIIAGKSGSAVYAMMQDKKMEEMRNSLKPLANSLYEEFLKTEPTAAKHGMPIFANRVPHIDPAKD